MFVSDSLLDLLAKQSNIYGLQLTGSSINVSLIQIEQFIGVYFRMGLVKMSSIRSYWETYIAYDGFSSVFRNRFLSILSNIHFVDNIGVTYGTKTMIVVGK